MIQLAPSLPEFELDAYRVPTDEVVAHEHRTRTRSHARRCSFPPWPGHGMTAPAGTRRTSQLSLAAVPTAVSCARLFVRNVLEQWRLTHLADTAELLASELVTISVLTTGNSDSSARSALVGDVYLIQVELISVGDDLIVCVWDRDARPPELHEVGLNSEGGRGMILIDRLSRLWGCYHPETGGKIVWCVVGTAVPTTGNGLPIRLPSMMSAPAAEIEDDPILLRRVVAQLQRL